MKTIGLIGGTGWISSVEYYRLVNEGINQRLGGQEFARCILYSLNYGDIARYSANNDDQAIFRLMEHAATSLVNCGAELLAICANTAHKYYDRLSAVVDVPIIHIADATAVAIRQKNIDTVGLLGTRMTMEGAFYQEVLARYGITTLVPDREDRDFIHHVIFNELFHADFKEESRQKFIDIMQRLEEKGAGGMVLGCTEIPLLIKQEHTPMPVFNTLEIHSDALVRSSLEK